jgi:hypothetical protein
MRSDDKQLEKEIRSHGYTVQVENGHRAVRNAAGNRVVTMSASASDYRALKNMRRDLILAGVLPRPSNEQRGNCKGKRAKLQAAHA